MTKTIGAAILFSSLMLGQTGGITPEALRKHVAYLASDKLGGRPLAETE